MIKSNVRSFWKFENNYWEYFYENSQLNLIKKELKTDANLFLQDKKALTKGSIVYTPEGFGVLMEIESNKNQKFFEEEEENAKIKVKINEEIKKFSSFDISTRININVKYVLKNTVTSEILLFPVNATIDDLIKQLNEDKKKHCINKMSFSNITIIYKGKKIKNSSNSLKINEFFEKNNETIVVAMSSYERHILKRYDINNNSAISDYWEMLPSRQDAIQFEVNKKVILLGLGIFNLSQKHISNSYPLRGYEMQLCVYKGNTLNNLVGESKLLLDYIEQSSVDKANKKYFAEVEFDNPISIEKDTIYTLVQKVFTNGQVFNLDQGLKEATGSGNVHFKFSGSEFSSNYTDEYCGQFPEIYYALDE